MDPLHNLDDLKNQLASVAFVEIQKFIMAGTEQ